MSLLQQIQDDQLQARFNKDKLRAGLLTTLYAEASMVGKNKQRETTDEETAAVIRKFIKNSNEIIANVPNSDLGAAARAELSILENYLPEQVSEDELRQTIDILVMGLQEKSMKAMGSIMGELNNKYPGQFDRAVASQIVKAALA